MRGKRLHIENVPTNDSRSHQPGYPSNTSLSTQRQVAGKTVHSGCAMAIHLLRGNRSGLPSTSHIGRSQPPCLACWFFLHILRTVNVGIFGVRRCFVSRAHLDWKYPEEELVRAGVSREIRGRIYEEFRRISAHP